MMNYKTVIIPNSRALRGEKFHRTCDGANRVGWQNTAWEQIAAIKGIKHRVDPLVRFELFQFNGANTLNKTRVIIRKSTHGDKRVHYSDTNVYRDLAPKHCRQHGNALFCKSIHRHSGMLERLEPVTICDQFPHLRFHQPEHESVGESDKDGWSEDEGLLLDGRGKKRTRGKWDSCMSRRWR